LVRWIAAKGKGLFGADGRCVRAVGAPRIPSPLFELQLIGYH
jgi:hypothetical protein